MDQNGVISVDFDQEMFVPEDTSEIEYGNIFILKVVSALDASSVEPKQ